jgi:hypothetical protein
MPRRTWVIPSGQNAHHNGGRSAWARPRMPHSRMANGPERSVPTPTQRRSDLPTAQRPGRTLTLAYFLGPLGPIASNAGRANRFWLLIGAASTLIGLVALWQGQDMTWRLQHGSGYGVLWLTLFAISWFGTCVAWSQGVTMAGHEVSGGMNRLPKAIGNPWFIGFMGAIFPGFGLSLSGYPRRAGIAILGYCALGLGALVLMNGRDLWTWNKISHYGGFPIPKLELVYLVAGGLALLGIVGWLVQLLDGIRLAERKAHAVSDHGDVFAFALMATLAISALVFRPAAFAAEFDHLAEWGQSKGFRITPYIFANLATHLDPSRPDYAMRVADIEESRGHKVAAKAIRTEIHSDWAIYRSFAQPVIKRPVQAQAASFDGPNPAVSPSVTVPSTGPVRPGPEPLGATTGPVQTVTQVPMGPEPAPVVSQTTATSSPTESPASASSVTQGVAAPPSPVKITSASPAPTTKATTTTTKATSTTKAATTPPKATVKTTKKKTATVHRSSPTTATTKTP